MELNIGIKEEQEEFLKQTLNEYSIDGIEKIIQVLSKEIIEKFDKKIVFGEIRCVGSCFSNDKFIKVELDDDLISKMKDIFKLFDFEDYDSEEEELSKVIRCIINYSEQECDMREVLDI